MGSLAHTQEQHSSRPSGSAKGYCRLSLSIGQGTTTRFPQLTQVASKKYQTISKSSKLAITLNTCDPHGQTWTGPKALKSLPKASGRRSVRLNRRRVGRRSRRVTVRLPTVRP